MNRMLLGTFQDDEVRMVIKEMGEIKLRVSMASMRRSFKDSGRLFNRVLDVCIDEAQGAFVPGRLITDNVLAAYEILLTFKNRRKGKKGFFTLKLDMSKAYDRVEWGFVTGVMRSMGFDEKWVELINHCISSVSYVVTINGRLNELFQPKQGLRQ
ncbi:uncharacterized protein LOC105789456 [Gossypium raimondii]|uniref:uncharacterized protein LOC105789456 n=1 Tax=Gossypium raimondii TaxID=29730 RepID=UPI00063AFBE2|nr:uncharacterized protein LOC105789456 [Gossypium raimondii]